MHESPEQYMDDSIRSVDSDKGLEDNPPYGTDSDDKLGKYFPQPLPLR